MVSEGCIFKRILDFSAKGFGIIIIFIFYAGGNVTGFPQKSSCPADQARLRPGGECFQLNTQGPCGQNMVFLSGGDGGECHCQDMVNPALCSSRPVVKAADDFTRCYPLYQKGPCQPGQWLVPRQDGAMGVCRKNPCQGSPASKLPGQGFIFVYEGMCYKTGTQGFCKPGEIALFEEGSRTPACFAQKTNGACSKTETNKVMTKTILAPSSQIECISGYTRSDDGDCSPIAQL